MVGETMVNYKKVQNKLEEFFQIYENIQKKKRINEDQFNSEVLAVKNDDTIIRNYQESEKRINAFINIAKNHTQYREEIVDDETVCINELSKLAVQINNDSKNDEFAKELYIRANKQLRNIEKCMSQFSMKKNMVLDTLEDKRDKNNEGCEKEFKILEEQFASYINSKEFSFFINTIDKSRNLFEESNGSEGINDNNFSLGVVKIPVRIPEVFKELFESKCNGYFDKEKSTLAIPSYFDFDRGSCFFVEYNNSTEIELFNGINSLIMNFFRYFTKKIEQVVFVDPIRFNGSALGEFEKLSLDSDSVIMRTPFSQDEISIYVASLLKGLNRESIEKKDGVNEERRILVFHDFPNSYSANISQMIQQLFVNAERFNLTIILTHKKSEKDELINSDLKYLIEKSSYIKCRASSFYLNGNDKMEFMWYKPMIEISDFMMKRMKRENNVEMDNDFFSRNSVTYTNPLKGNRRLDDIPYAIDESGTLQYIDFENSNFATYLCGAARSGKSTLLHSLIASLIMNNHPDDIEIWLVDFKMTEFSLYANNIPPHVRYIILDESPELVYDLIDRLTEILIKRQNIFKGKWQKLSDVPAEKYMPSIMVIIDEFSVMSQIIAESVSSSSENYVLKLQNLLAKGAALGMHFIFSSQGFSNGTRGLSEFSKNQIQQRIAMKTDYAEIKDTLELKSTSEFDQMLMEQLEGHHALIRIPVDDMGNHLKRVKPLCINNYNDLDLLISDLKKKYNKCDVYRLDDLVGYICKQPLVIDGNRYVSFKDKKNDMKTYFEKDRMGYNLDEIVMFLGEPRRMASVYPVIFNNEFCENMVVFASVKEKMPAASIVLSIMNSLSFTGGKVNIWTSKSNDIYKLILSKDVEFGKKSAIDIEEICSRIKYVRSNIESRIISNEVYILLGMEMILMDMNFLDTAPSSKDNNNKIITIEKREEGELDILSQMLAGSPVVPSDDRNRNYRELSSNINEEKNLLYDARDDLKYIFTHGPRFGYHFVLVFNSTGDFKQNKLDESLFKHKVFFRNSKNETFGYVNSLDSRVISEMETHHFRYCNGIESVSFRPFLHSGLSWDGWSMVGDSVENTVSENEYLL